ncbi:MAG: hypothetical protein K6D02_08930 [Lachnospiraceae bacterium]|nr:hypothetical protein [Lachnospiraceae bacterium]
MKSNMYSKYFKRGLAVLLTTAMVVSSPLGTKSQKAVKAATTEYVKEVVLSYGKTEEDARSWLEKNDYKVVDGDINAGTDSKDAVYAKEVNVVLMGYKTTTDQDKAIRDLAVMNMSGNYDITDMETILTSKNKELQDEFDEFVEISNEYVKCYRNAVKAKARGKSECAGALVAHDILNKYIEDDSGKGMGDYLLTSVKSDEGKEKLFKVLIQANKEIVMCMKNALLMASGDGKENWLEKLSLYNSKKSYFKRIKEVKKSSKLAKKYIDSKYGSKMDILVSQWDELRERIVDYIDSSEAINKKYEKISDNKTVDNEELLDDYFDVDREKIDELSDNNPEKMDSEELIESFEDTVEQQKAVNEESQFVETAAVVNYLDTLKYGDGTLLEFFLLNPSEEAEKDFYEGGSLKTTLKGEELKYEFAAVLEAMTDVQFDALGESLNLFTAIKYAITGEKNVWDNLKTADKKNYNTELKEVEKCSVYNGVNREMFKEGVALTQAGQKSDKSIYDDVIQNGNGESSGNNIGLLILGAATTLIGTTILVAGATNWIRQAINLGFTLHLKDSNFILKLETKVSRGWYQLVSGDSERYMRRAYRSFVDRKITEEQFNRVWYKQMAIAHSITVFVGIALTAIGLYFSITSINNLIDERKKYYKGNYSVAIPKYMVDLNQDDDDNSYLTCYEAALCNRNDKDMTGFKRDEEGLKDFGDINGDNGRQWVALYYSTDEVAGDPILADSFEVRYGKNSFDEEYRELHSFNEPEAGFNLTSAVYCYNDKKNGTYLRYKVDEESDSKNTPASTASLFGNGGKNTGLIVTSGIVGVILGFVGASLTRRRKEEE